MDNKQMPEKLRVNLAQAPWIKCSENNSLFETKLLFKRLSPLVSPTGKAEEIPLETIVCTKCGKVPKFFFDKAPDIPEELRSTCTF